jgi:quercetin dioxygenase-like cupin family protein
MPERIVHLTEEAGEARWWFGSLARIKLDGKQTDAKFSLIEVWYPSNLEVPLHVHTREDEGFHVLEGKIAYRVGDSRFEASPGHTLFAPKNIPHGFIGISAEPVRYLIVYSPAGYEDFIRETSEPAVSLTLPPPPDGPPDPAKMAEIGAMMSAKYGCHFLP